MSSVISCHSPEVGWEGEMVVVEEAMAHSSILHLADPSDKQLTIVPLKLGHPVLE